MEVRHDIAGGLREGTRLAEEEVGKSRIAAESGEAETPVGGVDGVFGFAHPLSGEAESQRVVPLDPGNVVVDVFVDVAFEIRRNGNGDPGETGDANAGNAFVGVAEREVIGEGAGEGGVVNEPGDGAVDCTPGIIVGGFIDYAGGKLSCHVGHNVAARSVSRGRGNPGKWGTGKEAARLGCGDVVLNVAAKGLHAVGDFLVQANQLFAGVVDGTERRCQGAAGCRCGTAGVRSELRIDIGNESLGVGTEARRVDLVTSDATGGCGSRVECGNSIEVACEQLGIGDCGDCGGGGLGAAPFLRPEEKCFALVCIVVTGNKDGAAKGVAEIVIPKRLFFHASLVVEEGVGVENVVANEFVSVAMKFAGTRLGDHIDLAAAAAAVLRIIGASLQLELCQSVHAGSVEKGEVGTTIIDVGAIHSPIVGSGAISIDRYRQSAA